MRGTNQVRLAIVTAALAMSAACGDRSSPAAPSARATEAFAPASAIEATAGAFGTTAFNPSRCQFAAEAACLSAARVHTNGTAAAATAPAAPTGLTATAAGNTVTLTWNAPASGDPAQTYVIEAGSTPGAANLANFSTLSAATSFTAANVAAGSYYVRVRAANSSGTSAPSNEALLVVGGGGCTAAPGAPSGLSVAANAGGTVTLVWSAAPGAPTSYIVEAGSAPGLANLANSDLGPATTLTANGVGPGTYYVRIRARNACGIGAASNEVVLTVGGSQPSGDVSGLWSGSAGPFAIAVQFTQTGTALTGRITTPPDLGSFNLALLSSSGSTLTFSGTMTLGTVRTGTLVVNTATNTMTGNFAGLNTDGLPETVVFTLQKQSGGNLTAQWSRAGEPASWQMARSR